LYSLKEGDEATGFCYPCKEKLPLKCGCGQESISDDFQKCIDCYYSDPRIRHDVNDE
jgi:predicted amidophosphoribosyltransferase